MKCAKYRIVHPVRKCRRPATENDHAMSNNRKWEFRAATSVTIFDVPKSIAAMVDFILRISPVLLESAAGTPDGRRWAL